VEDLIRRVIYGLSQEWKGELRNSWNNVKDSSSSLDDQPPAKKSPSKDEIFGSLNEEVFDPKAFLKMERLTYEKSIEELKSIGEDVSFGDDLSDTALRKLGELHRGFYFITDWPMKLKPFYIHEKENHEELSCSFDLQYGYLELVSGGRRQHDREKLKSRIIEQGLDPAGFQDHLKAFEWGMPPHSGWGLGFDRLMMVLTNSQNVREVVLYPRDVERLNP
jgi:nondiscriminating aspartyl-tRNA synthetase